MQNRSSLRWPVRIAAIIAILFGVLTVFSGGSALFGDAQTRAVFGDAVSFVVWFNFLSGFAYVLAGVGIAGARQWAVALSIALALTITLVYAFFAMHVYQGAAYEMRTVGAMSLRLVVWVTISLLVVRAIGLPKFRRP